jgi:predicted HTH domain antitoxin
MRDGGDPIMSLWLAIPDSVVQAIRLPEKRMREEMLLELAIALYAQEALSFGEDDHSTKWK